MLTDQELQSLKNRFGIIGNDPSLNYSLTVASQVANTDLTVLIQGESGVGKEVFSQIIHTLSAMGWQSVGSSGLVGLWMRQHGLDWCLVAHQNNDCTFTVTVTDYSRVGELPDSRRYWAYIPMSSAVMDS